MDKLNLNSKIFYCSLAFMGLIALASIWSNLQDRIPIKDLTQKEKAYVQLFNEIEERCHKINNLKVTLQQNCEDIMRIFDQPLIQNHNSMSTRTHILTTIMYIAFIISVILSTRAGQHEFRSLFDNYDDEEDKI